MVLIFYKMHIYHELVVDLPTLKRFFFKTFYRSMRTGWNIKDAPDLRFLRLAEYAILLSVRK